MSPADEYDVVVVGFGFAGGVAAIEAHDSGARVLLLEKQPHPGGISVCSAGGIRMSRDPDAALAYLKETNAGTTPDDVLDVLARGMAEAPDYVRFLAESVADRMTPRIEVRDASANYPLPGHDSFGFVYIEDIPGFDAAEEFPFVRGSPAGARLFKLVLENVRARPAITLRCGVPAERLIRNDAGVAGVVAGGGEIGARRGVVLACGGFEGSEELQRQFWSVKPVLSAAIRANTGDGLRMAQGVGAGLWHLWHFHGSYGFRHPEPAYPFGIRVKRLPDWVPGRPFRNDVRMSWILVDRSGCRFMNEYEPYLQDTGHRPLEAYDPATQTYSRIPSLLIVDAAGRALYPLSAPTWHDEAVATRFAGTTPRGLDDEVLTTADTIEDLARAFDIDPGVLGETVARWNAACADGGDHAFGRPAGSMMPLATPPFSAAQVWPIVSNTQGGPAHDAAQRVLDAFGQPIPRLYEAGEVGSVFGHLYMSGGNIAECFVGGRIAGRAAAAEPLRTAGGDA